jgi:spermidine synthase
MKHPNIKLTADYNNKYMFDVEKYLYNKRKGAKDIVIDENTVVNEVIIVSNK